MSFLRSLTLTFAMYSKIPMPVVEWDEKNMQWVFPCFPLVGAVVGAVLALWLHLAAGIALSRGLRAAIAVALPVVLTGGIHLDGLCDTCDALGSHQSKERKLEILKDSHIGAFGVIGCVLYLLVSFGVWEQLVCTDVGYLLLALVPVASRSWVALAAVTQQNARGTGLLATFVNESGGVWCKRLIGLWLLVSLALQLLTGISGCCAVVAEFLVTCWFVRMSRQEFGGITGDLAGWYLQMLELAAFAAIAVAETVV